MIKTDGTLSGEVSLPGGIVSGKIGVIGDISAVISIPDTPKQEIYDGEYVVTPKVAERTILPTTGKVMKDDVTVKEIPIFKTSNESGGYTFYIGREEM